MLHISSTLPHSKCCSAELPFRAELIHAYIDLSGFHASTLDVRAPPFCSALQFLKHGNTVENFCSALQFLKYVNTVEKHNGIMFDFCLELPHVLWVGEGYHVLPRKTTNEEQAN